MAGPVWACNGTTSEASPQIPSDAGAEAEYQKAIDAWQKVLDKYPNNSNTLNNIEQARLRLGAQEPEN